MIVDEMSDFPEDLDIKLPPQTKGKLEYHSTAAHVEADKELEAELMELTAEMARTVTAGDNMGNPLIYAVGVESFVARVQALVDKAVEAAEKAFGGCKKCYGKGYATVARGEIGYDDFGGEGFKTPITTRMVYCTCDRGKQLKAIMEIKES